MADRQPPYREIVAQLKTELAQAEREVAQARKRALRIRTALAALSGLVSANEGREGQARDGKAPMAHVPAASPEARGISGEPRGTIITTAERVVREAGRPMHIDEIVDGVLAAGVQHGDRDVLRMSLGRTLDKKVRRGVTFRKTAPATFDLKDRHGAAGRPAAAPAGSGGRQQREELIMSG